jgi:hypothetical protein
MNRTIGVGIGLALGIFAASLHAQEAQWRASPSASSQPAATLLAPIPDAPAIRQTGVNDSQTSQPVVRAMMNDVTGTSQPLPLGPSVGFDAPPAPIQRNTGSTFSEPAAPGEVSNWVSISTATPSSVSSAIVADSEGTLGDRIRSKRAAAALDTSSLGAGCGLCGETAGDACSACDACGICGNGCPPRSKFWVSGEYMLWTEKRAPLPSLVTTNPNATPADFANYPSNYPIIGVAGTGVAVGGNQDYNMLNGAKFTIGMAVPYCGDLGFESTFFFLGNRINNTTLSSDPNGFPAIGRPFTEVFPQAGPTGNGSTGIAGNQSAELVSFPGQLAGNINIQTSTEMWGVEGNFRIPMYCGCNYKIDFLAGFRYLELDEGLTITENITGVPGGIFDGSSTSVMDSFHTRNDFYGGQIGIDAEWRVGKWSFEGIGKIAAGDMKEVVSINGSSSNTIGGVTTTNAFGVFALPSNIGRYSQDNFCLLPELGAKIGYNLTPRLRGFVGYDILYASTVVRPGDQMSTTLNSSSVLNGTPISGAPLPTFQARPTDFWAQGVSFGLEWRY